MALFNRFFGTARRKQFNKYQDNVCEKLFTFTQEQVRVVVFRECDFRGRKLLFDSHSVRRVSLASDLSEATPTIGEAQSGVKRFVEMTNGHGYMYTKPLSDVGRLGEMIFGSVAMSYRGTTCKVHVVQTPRRLVCSQVFPSPKHPVKQRNCSSTHAHVAPSTTSSLEQSIRLEDSGTSSVASCSDHSILSTGSDTLLVCRRQRSLPLDVPPSLVSSSGFGEMSHSSISSGPQSIPIDLNQGNSGDSLYKQWFQSTSTSLEHLTTSLPCSEESFPKIRSSKIGLAVLIEFPEGQEEKLERFLMEHATFLETMMQRIRRSVENAYLRHSTFVSAMHSMAVETSCWFVEFLSCARAVPHVWHSLASNCDSLFSIIAKSPSISFLEHLGSRALPVSEGSDFTFLNLSRFLKGDRKEPPTLAEKFVGEFCELLDGVDVKQTNFFMSTLVTAVLTHHLGWVSTVLPQAKSKHSNAFCQQLSELYGAVGFPLKMARTIVCGMTNSEITGKIVNILTYFIRCTEIRRCENTRVNIEADNVETELICRSSIPKENYKKYSDHLREMEIVDAQFVKPKKKLGLTKMHTCLTDLNKLSEDNNNLNESVQNDRNVVFVLGENEKLIGIKPPPIKTEQLKPSTSFTSLNLQDNRAEFKRAQSEPPHERKYPGVKFNFHQYPEIFENYMRGKNIELANMEFSEKLEVGLPSFEFTNCDVDSEVLTTPSNASELEFNSELVAEKTEMRKARERVAGVAHKAEFKRALVPNVVIKEVDRGSQQKQIKDAKNAKKCADKSKLNIVELPMPKSNEMFSNFPETGYTGTMVRGLCDRYIPDMVLQGTNAPRKEWDMQLRRDLVTSVQQPFLNQRIDESIAIVANTDSWDVQLISSHTYVIDRNVSGVPVGMSQLVANMLETLLHMWRLHTPAEYCLLHIEHQLQEFCVRSKALAQLLLDTEFCSMEILTSTLHLEVNDVPLLMAVASTHTPQVTQKYGLSFQ